MTTTERNKQIVDYANKGKKLADIGRMFELSRERIRQIVKKYGQLNNN